MYSFVKVGNRGFFLYTCQKYGRYCVASHVAFLALTCPLKQGFSAGDPGLIFAPLLWDGLENIWSTCPIHHCLDSYPLPPPPQ
jgi:hypothetical protein